MIDEYEERFGKTHKCKVVLKKILRLYDAKRFILQEETPLRLAMPEEFRSDNPIISYRKFYASKPRVRYPKDKVPSWFEKYRGNIPYQII